MEHELVTQPAQSPDLNTNDLGFFASLNSRVWRERYRTLDALVEGLRAYTVSITRILQLVLQCWKHWEETISTLGYTGSRERQREGLLDHLVPIDRGAYGAALYQQFDGDDDSDGTMNLLYCFLYEMPMGTTQQVIFFIGGLLLRLDQPFNHDF